MTRSECGKKGVGGRGVWEKGMEGGGEKKIKQPQESSHERKKENLTAVTFPTPTQ